MSNQAYLILCWGIPSQLERVRRERENTRELPNTVLMLCFFEELLAKTKRASTSGFLSKPHKTMHNVTLILCEYVLLECRLLWSAPISKEFHRIS
jgi:hypothetical protein